MTIYDNKRQERNENPFNLFNPWEKDINNAMRKRLHWGKVENNNDRRIDG